MVIKSILGTRKDFKGKGLVVEALPLEWWECSKRILHKRTETGREVAIRLLNTSSLLRQDDVLFAGENLLIVVDVLPCEVIVLQPGNMFEMAYASYEIGNKHLPLFFEDNCLLIPYDAPVFRLLEASGFQLKREQRKLLNRLRTTVSPHQHRGNEKESLFSKIMKLTTPSSHD